MANDDETLTFRLRAIAENMSAFGKAARGAEDVNAAMIKSQKTAESLAISNRKLTAARDKEADAAGRVKVAEEKLNEVRNATGAKMSQIAAAEERLATARRNSSRATNDANRIEADFKNVAEKALSRVAEASGREAGHRFGFGFSKTINDGSIENESGKIASLITKIFGKSGHFAGREFSFGFKNTATTMVGDAEKSASLVGRTFGTGILSGMEGILKSEAGPFFLAALVAAAALAAPAIGAILAGGIILAFGGGLAALGIIFAAKTAAVKAQWKVTTAAMAADMKDIAKPFDGVLLHLFGSMRSTLSGFAPLLKQAFGGLASPLQKFFDDVLKAIEKFKPAIAPLTQAFAQLLGALGPGLKDTFASIADGLIKISDSVSKNPKGLADFLRGIGNLTDLLFRIIAILNDANGAFERLTGGTSAVTVTMDTLVVAVGLLLGPLVLLAKYVTWVSDAINALEHNNTINGKSMSDAANSTVGLANALGQTGSQANSTSPAVAALAAKTAAAAKAAADAKTKFEAWITALFGLQNLAQTLAEAQLNVKQAMADAAASITGNSAKIQAARDREANAVGRVRTAEAQLAALRSSGKATHAQMVAAEERLAAAKRAVASASDALSRATSANSKTIDENTQKGRDSKRNLLAVSQAIKVEIEALARDARGHGQLTDAMVKAGQGTVKMHDRAVALSAGFVQLAIKMGYPIPVAKAMAKQLIAIPNVSRTAKLIADKHDLDTKLAAARRSLADPNLTRERKAHLNADIAVLQRKIAQAQRQIDALHGKTVEVKYQSFGVTTWSAVHTAHGVAATGKKIRGPGSGTSDTAGMFALSNNEWVIKAKSSQKYGDYAMGSVNDGTATIIPGMASGGPAHVNLVKTGVFHSVAEGNAFFNKVFGASSAPGAGAGVQKWAPVALAALRAAGAPPSWLPSLLRRMNQESGGNPRAINLTDSNARAGDPSRGLMQCVPLDSEILTRRGWLRHDQVIVGDETIGYNPATGRSEWTRITKVVHYGGAPITRIGNRHWHARTTPNHRWWSDTEHRVVPGMPEVCPECGWEPRGKKAPARGVQVHRNKMHGIARASSQVEYRGEFVRTENLTYGDRLRLAAPADTSGIPTLSLTDVRILAWLQGDGTLREAENGRGWDGIIWQSKPEQIIKLRALLVGIEHTEVVRPRRAAHHFEPHAFRLRRAFVTDLIKRSGLIEMGPEAFVLALSPDQRAAWLDSMIDAEGHRQPGKKPGYREFVRIAQINGPLQDAITLAVYLEGYRPTYSANAAERNGYQPAGVVGMAQPHVVPSMFDEPEHLEPETVWCVKTDLETWTMRQDAQVMLTGNTIGSTFNAYAGRFRSRGIYDPFANIYAAIQYTIARYGSGPAGWNRPGGYSLGGKVNSYRNGTPYVPYDGLAYLHRGERVSPAGSGGDVHIHLEGAIIASEQQALDWLTKGIDTLKRQRRIAV